MFFIVYDIVENIKWDYVSNWDSFIVGMYEMFIK